MVAERFYGGKRRTVVFRMVPDSLVSATASRLAMLVRSGSVTAEEVVSAHLDRIESVNGRLNAVVQLAADEAIAQARRVDARFSAGGPVGRLHGVPFTVKDWIDVAGWPCTGADVRFRERVPSADATVVSRMRDAGAIFLGKTNAVSGNDVYGRTNNPYDLRRTPGSSSSGEAAIVAAGGSPLGLGSDSGGSIRQPAHNCGIAGLKPTTGRVPLTGHFPFIAPLLDPRTVIGPLARSVEDLYLALVVIAGPDGIDPSCAPVPLLDPADVTLESLRAAFYTDHDGATPNEEVAEATRKVARDLADTLAVVDEAQPDRLDEVYEITRDYWRRPESEDPWVWQPDGAARLSGDAVESHLFAWDRFRRSTARFMRNFDVIVTPAAESVAAIHGEDEGGIAFTLAYSLTGYPAVTVRGGTARNGMPIGIQIVAAPWREDMALAVAMHVERKFGGYARPSL